MKFMSNLLNKSDILKDAAALLHSRNLYPAVAHSAYYSCYQLLKHIWLHGMGKSQEELDAKCSVLRMGSHEFLINEIGQHIKGSSNKRGVDDFRVFNTNITQLKRLRVSADYDDAVFDSSKSDKSITLSALLTPILKKY
jgi:hypothetical protein